MDTFRLAGSNLLGGWLVLRRFCCAIFLSVCAMACLRAAAPEDSRATKSTRSFQFIYTVQLKQVIQRGKSLGLWVPLPRTEEFQTVTGLNVSTPFPYARSRDAEYGNEYIFLRASSAQLKAGQELVSVQFQVERREHVVRLNEPAPHSLADSTTKAQLDRYLAADRLVPTTGLITALAEEQTKGLKTKLEKAHAIYDYVVRTLRYDKTGEGWGHGDAIWACTAKRGNCTDFHSLFIGMLRSQGIPARFEIGFPLPEDQREGSIPGYHCWAEFYVEPYGWIPVDASEAWKHPEKRDYYFGSHDVNRVLFTFGRDLHLDSAQDREPLNYFVYPYAELDGSVFKGLEQSFSFRDVAGSR